MRVMDIVTINDINNTPAIVESIRTYEDGMTIYSVRSPYTGTLYAREADEITPATDEVRDATLQDMRYMPTPAAECEIVKDYGDAVMTNGVINAEIASTMEAAKHVRPLGTDPSWPWVIGINASTNMFF